jgi:hypothetical protein
VTYGARDERGPFLLRVSFPVTDDEHAPPADLSAAGERLRQTYEAIGRFIARFSLLQMVIRAMVLDALKLDEKYLEIVTAPYDFAGLCSPENRPAD